jgi:hypothetical protein
MAKHPFSFFAEGKRPVAAHPLSRCSSYRAPLMVNSVPHSGAYQQVIRGKQMSLCSRLDQNSSKKAENEINNLVVDTFIALRYLAENCASAFISSRCKGNAGFLRNRK